MYVDAVNISSGITTRPPLRFNSGTNLTTAVAGAVEYDGTVPYITPSGAQRGVIPGAQYYRLESNAVGQLHTSAQGVFGANTSANVGVVLSSSTVYEFEAVYLMFKTAGTTGHTINLSFGGSATLNNIGYFVYNAATAVGFNSPATVAATVSANTAASTISTGSFSTAGVWIGFTIRGTVSVNAGGTFIPRYTISVVPGVNGVYTTAPGSYFLIYPIGAAGANTSVGTWAITN